MLTPEGYVCFLATLYTISMGAVYGLRAFLLTKGIGASPGVGTIEVCTFCQLLRPHLSAAPWLAELYISALFSPKSCCEILGALRLGLKFVLVPAGACASKILQLGFAKFFLVVSRAPSSTQHDRQWLLDYVLNGLFRIYRFSLDSLADAGRFVVRLVGLQQLAFVTFIQVHTVMDICFMSRNLRLHERGSSSPISTSSSSHPSVDTISVLGSSLLITICLSDILWQTHICKVAFENTLTLAPPASIPARVVELMPVSSCSNFL